MKPISYQLYSSRNYSPLADTFSMLSKLGYSQVEGFGGLFAEGVDIGKLKADLDANNLHMATCHFSLEAVRDQPDTVISHANSLNTEVVFVPAVSPDQRTKTAAGWEALGKTLAEIGKPLQDAGLKFGWHNHAFEFAAIDSELLPLDLILAGDDSLLLEFDVAWCVVGKQNPLTWIEQYSDRLISAHIKDLAPEGECLDEDGWADVGQGTMDWPALLKALDTTAVQYRIMEHDNPNDHHRFASRSIETLNSLLVNQL
ncbi:MAG: sugar phosphate isomerase/epimerase family protein [Granulosicoccus sp.]